MYESLITNEQSILSKYNKIFAGSEFDTLKIGIIEESPLLRAVKYNPREIDMKNIIILEDDEKALEIYYSRKCFELIKQRNPDFLDLRLAYLAHEVIESHYSVNNFENVHERTNNLMKEMTKKTYISNLSIATDGTWDDLSSLIGKFSAESGKPRKNICWYITPRLVLIK